MAEKVKVVESYIENGYRYIKTTTGRSGTIVSLVTTGGVDFCPPRNSLALRTNTQSDVVCTSRIGRAKDDLSDGESSLYSVAGNKVASHVTTRVSGIVEVNGDSDYAVLYSKLETEFNKLQSDFNSFVEKVQAATCVEGMPLVFAVPPSENTSDITKCKSSKVKLG